MLTIKLITEETERVVKGLEKKHFPNARAAVEKVIATDKVRRETQQKLDANKAEAKKISAQIGALMKDGKKDEAEKVKQQVAELKTLDKQLEAEMSKAEDDVRQLLLTIPNFANEQVPEGKDANDNVVVKEGGPMPNLPEDAMCHWDLCKKYNLIDFELGTKITGAGFPVYIGKMARFQRLSRLSSSRRHAKADTLRYSRHTWSTRPAASAQDSCPTKTARCITARWTTSTSSPPPRCR